MKRERYSELRWTPQGVVTLQFCGSLCDGGHCGRMLGPDGSVWPTHDTGYRHRPQ